MPILSRSITQRVAEDSDHRRFLSSDGKHDRRKPRKAVYGLNNRISNMLRRASLSSSTYSTESFISSPSHTSKKRSRVSSNRSSSSIPSSEVPKTPVGVEELHKATQGNNVGADFSVLGINESLPSWRDQAMC